MHVEVCFSKWCGETRYVHLLADGAASFLENITPRVDQIFVPMIASRSAGAENGMIILQGVAAIFFPGCVPVHAATSVSGGDAKSPAENRTKGGVREVKTAVLQGGSEAGTSGGATRAA